jgi:hypothetical protein
MTYAVTELAAQPGSLPVPFPPHPEPHSMTWSPLEVACIKKYAEDCVRAATSEQAVALLEAYSHASKNYGVALQAKPGHTEAERAAMLESRAKVLELFFIAPVELPPVPKVTPLSWPFPEKDQQGQRHSA